MLWLLITASMLLILLAAILITHAGAEADRRMEELFTEYSDSNKIKNVA